MSRDPKWGRKLKYWSCENLIYIKKIKETYRSELKKVEDNLRPSVSKHYTNIQFVMQKKMSTSFLLKRGSLIFVCVEQIP